MSEHATPRRPEIWRDGDRIVSDLQGGYWDKVSDEDIAQHAIDADDPIARAFAAATLGIRAYERVALAERVRRETQAISR